MPAREILARPTLILVMGVAGSGKTTLARRLLERVPATYLDKDVVADALFPGARTDRRYLEMRPRLYEALYRIAEENLRFGNSVLLDAPHVKQMQDERWRSALEGLVLRSSSALAILRCFCSEAGLRRRLLARGEPRDAWKLENWGEFLEREPLLATIPFDHIDIDTERPLQENVERAVRYVRAQDRAR